MFSISPFISEFLSHLLPVGFLSQLPLCSWICLCIWVNTCLLCLALTLLDNVTVVSHTCECADWCIYPANLKPRLWFIRPILKSECAAAESGVWKQFKHWDTYPLFEQLCDLLFVLLQIIFYLRESSHGELLPVVRTELLQLGLGLVCGATERTRGWERSHWLLLLGNWTNKKNFKSSDYARGCVLNTENQPNKGLLCCGRVVTGRGWNMNQEVLKHKDTFLYKEGHSWHNQFCTWTSHMHQGSTETLI